MFMLKAPSNNALSRTMQTHTEQLPWCVGGPWSHMGSMCLLLATSLQKIIYKKIYLPYLHLFKENIWRRASSFLSCLCADVQHIQEASDQEHMWYIWDLLDLLHTDHTNACIWSNIPQLHWISPTHMDCSCFGLGVLVQTTRNMLDLLKCVHLCTDQLYRAHSTGIIYLVDSTSTQMYTFPCDFWAIALAGMWYIRNPAQIFLCPYSRLNPSPHLWNPTHRLSLSIKTCYCLRYPQVEKCTVPVVALQYKLSTYMHERKQAEDGSAAVWRRFFYNAKWEAFFYLCWRD